MKKNKDLIKTEIRLLKSLKQFILKRKKRKSNLYYLCLNIRIMYTGKKEIINFKEHNILMSLILKDKRSKLSKTNLFFALETIRYNKIVHIQKWWKYNQLKKRLDWINNEIKIRQ